LAKNANVISDKHTHTHTGPTALTGLLDPNPAAKILQRILVLKSYAHHSVSAYLEQLCSRLYAGRPGALHELNLHKPCSNDVPAEKLINIELQGIRQKPVVGGLSVLQSLPPPLLTACTGIGPSVLCRDFLCNCCIQRAAIIARFPT